MSNRNIATVAARASFSLTVALLLGACAADFNVDPSGEDPIANIGRTQQPLTGALAYRGVNLCAAEFGVDAYGVGALPGTFGTNYTYPDPAYVSGYNSTDYFMSKGMTTFRLPFRWERLQPQRGQALDATELTRLKTTVGRMLGKGAAVILDPQNFARYGQATIGSSTVPNSQFADFWTRLANEFKSNQNVIFGLVNEPHDINSEQWLGAANAAIAGIRSTGATNLVLVPGNAWTGAHSWTATWYGTPNSVAMLNVVDPGNNYAFEVHQYLDADSGGGGSECVSATIGSERMKAFTNWLRANNKRGFLGEFGGPATSTCTAAMDDILKHVEANSDVYLGWTAWAGGPWWKGYALSMEPVSSNDSMQMKAIASHLAWNAPAPPPPAPPPTSTPTTPPPPTTPPTACTVGTYEAESMTKSTGGATSGGWNVWSNGYLATTRYFSAGSTTITVHAAGQSAGGVAPRMVVSVGGAVVGTANVTSTSFAPYAFTFAATEGSKEIRVTFDNDAVVGTEDRNLLVDKVVVGCPVAQAVCRNQTFEAESMTKSTGGATSGGWNLWSNGSVSTSADFADGPASIVVRASGTKLSNTWAHFVVSVDGQTIGSGNASTTTYRDYSFPFTARAGKKQITVAFDNDASSKREDRNLLVDKVSVVCP